MFNTSLAWAIRSDYIASSLEFAVREPMSTSMAPPFQAGADLSSIIRLALSTLLRGSGVSGQEAIELIREELPVALTER